MGLSDFLWSMALLGTVSGVIIGTQALPPDSLLGGSAPMLVLLALVLGTETAVRTLQEEPGPGAVRRAVLWGIGAGAFIVIYFLWRGL